MWVKLQILMFGVDCTLREFMTCHIWSVPILKVNKPLKIYIAGPYTGKDARETALNVYKAIVVGVEIWKRGHYPYIPHLTHYIWIHPSGNLTYEEWLEWDKPWLESCDALFYLSSSKGADKDLEFAKTLNKIIFHNIVDIPKVDRT